MKMKKKKMKLELNKITICRLDNLQMQFVQAGLCPPPTKDETVDPENGCSEGCNPTEYVSTAPC